MIKVLVVEDDVILAGAYRLNFETAKFAVVVARRAETAIDELKKQIPDIVILDLILPGKDGFWLFEQMKNNSKWKNIPILVASNIGDPEEIKRARKMGAKEYVIKSEVSMKQMIGKVRKLVK